MVSRHFFSGGAPESPKTLQSLTPFGRAVDAPGPLASDNQEHLLLALVTDDPHCLPGTCHHGAGTEGVAVASIRLGMATVAIFEIHRPLVIQVIAKQLVTLHTRDYPEHFQMTARPMNEVIVDDFRQTLFLLIAAVIVLLLISSSNVASLFCSRITVRVLYQHVGLLRWIP
jgi:hypothetical protein